MTVEVLAPTTLAEALAARADQPEAVVIAGGTDLMVELNARQLHPAAWIDLSGVQEFRGWRTIDGSFELGVGVTYTEILEGLEGFVPLTQASATVGSPPDPQPGHGRRQPGARVAGRRRFVAVVDLIDRHPHLTRAAAAEALAGRPCRCTGYQKIIDATLLAASRTVKARG